MNRFKTVLRSHALVALLPIFLGSIVAKLGAETESPNALSQIILTIPSQQVVGHPWSGPVQILLLDENSDLVADYDLGADPITLTVSDGSISPAVISDSSLFSAGVIDLAVLDMVYRGRTGPVTITASNSTISSSGLLVTFNGCDISQAIGLAEDTVSAVYSEVNTTVAAVVGNAGSLAPTEPASLKAFFRSGGGSIRIQFEAGAIGQLDTVVISLPTSGLASGGDTLMLVSESVFDLGGGELTTGDTLWLPVQVIVSNGLTILSGSLKPDSVYAAVPFDLAFAAVADGIQAPFDSTVASVSLLSDTDSVLAVVFEGAILPNVTVADTLFYSSLPAEIKPVPDLPAGRYALATDYSLHIGGLTLTAVEAGLDSLVILDPVAPTYVGATLAPNQIASGAEAGFQFELHLAGTETMHLHPEESSFELFNNGFSVNAHLLASGDSLYPGSNLIQTEKLYVPNEFLGADLSVRAAIVYHHAGAGNFLLYETDFGGETIAVQAVPLVKIIEALIVAPNAPKVNSGQAFQIECWVTNVSSTDSDPFDLVLVSDGDSQFDSLLTTEPIAGGDTSVVHFEVVASATPNVAEIFRVEVAPFTVNHLLPDDNVAMATVQRPAELSVSLLLIGADDGRVDVGERFDLLIGLVNTGDGDATDGRFRINTNGIYLGLPDSALVTEVVISVGGVRGISFQAPDFDTTISINVDLIERPIDNNTGLPALFGDTSFQVDLAITSQIIDLMVEFAGASSNLVVAGESKELFRLRVTNPGQSSLSNIELESMTFSFIEAGSAAPRVRSLVEVGSTGLFINDQKLTRATAGDDVLRLSFDGFVVAAGQTVELGFCTKSKAEAGTEFSIVLDAQDIVARYAAGPLAGLPVVATTPGEDQLVVNQVYTSVLGDLENSLVVRNNPFYPLEGPAEFRYYLERPQQIRFVVLTLSGELVHEKLFEADATGGQTGENTVFWDGRNDGGEVVLSGVYIVVVTTEAGRERAILKLAVMK